MKNIPSEILAPAGDMQRLKYALAYGADAVYSGQPQFSLRNRENGFQSPVDIAEAIEYTHKMGKKFYLTSNIIPHNNKIKPFQESLLQYIDMKPDAYIMTDPGMIAFVKKNDPNAEIHLSVQANCTNWSTAQYWYDQGVSRVILSRELNLREVRDIHQNVPGLEIEVFVHGAICMAHSGRCMLSNYMSHRDANQGMCSNACRFQYKLYAQNKPQSGDKYVPLEGNFFLHEKDAPSDELMPVDEDEYGTYFMNSKDMCAIEMLDKLKEAGVISFKIEGRTKSIYYLSQVVRGYRGAVDDIEAGREVNPKHIATVKSTDSRGYIPGFFSSANKELPQNYETTKVPGQGDKVAALVNSWDSETQLATLSVKGKMEANKTLRVFSPTAEYNFEVSEFINHKNKIVDVINPGMENCKVKLSQDPGEFAFITC